MKKIGIMSMQRIANYGSFLQAFALKKTIESFGYEVIFIDYHPGNVLEKTNINNSKIDKALKVLKLKAPIKEKISFIKYKKNYSKKFLPMLGINSSAFYQTDDLDTLVIGSDEVFNCVQQNPQVGFAKDLFGVNSNARKLISYAASFGNTTLSKLKRYGIAEEVKEYLYNFDELSVRDENSKQVVETLIDRKPNVNIDPVLLYFNKGVLDMTIYKYGCKKKLPYNYMILYGYTGRFSLDECMHIERFAKKKNLKIVCLGGIQHCCDKFISADPYEVLNLFKNARYVITDTFHGSILSIINTKPFVTTIRRRGYGNAQKLDNLLSTLKLNNRRLVKFHDLNKIMESPIDYSLVNKRLDKLREEAKIYLKKSL